MSVARVIKYKCRACGTMYNNKTEGTPCGVCIVAGRPGVGTLSEERGPIAQTNGLVEGVPLGRRVAEPYHPVAAGGPLEVSAMQPRASGGQHQEARLVSVGGKRVDEIQRDQILKMQAEVMQPLSVPVVAGGIVGGVAGVIMNPLPPGANGGSALGMAPPKVAPPKIATSMVDGLDVELERYSTGIPELDRMLGGGLVRGTSILLSGPPGIGKTTLVTQALAGIAAKLDEDVLFMTGEETRNQVMHRAKRVDARVKRLYVARGDSDREIARAVDEVSPHVLVIDSLQAFRDEEGDGEIATMKRLASVWDAWSKRFERVVIFLCQVNKDDSFAGPRKVEHLVDAHFMFEEVSIHTTRLIAKKNRLGPRVTNLWRMTPKGLIAEPEHYGHPFAEVGSEHYRKGSHWCLPCKRDVSEGDFLAVETFPAYLLSKGGTL